jgi:hypothetical protein
MFFAREGKGSKARLIRWNKLPDEKPEGIYGAIEVKAALYHGTDLFQIMVRFSVIHLPFWFDRASQKAFFDYHGRPTS